VLQRDSAQQPPALSVSGSRYTVLCIQQALSCLLDMQVHAVPDMSPLLQQ
jgi:hypothetical protein